MTRSLKGPEINTVVRQLERVRSVDVDEGSRKHFCLDKRRSNSANILRGIDTVRWKRATRRYCTTFERLDETKASVTMRDSIFATRSALNDCKPNRIFAKLEERNSDLNLMTNV